MHSCLWIILLMDMHLTIDNIPYPNIYDLTVRCSVPSCEVYILTNQCLITKCCSTLHEYDIWLSLFIMAFFWLHAECSNQFVSIDAKLFL